MVERFMDFNEYVREYELGRAEGSLLRYLSETYKALVQTVPAKAKTPEVEDIEVFLRAIIRSVDSSLLDEWERLRAHAEGAPWRETDGAAPFVAELGEPDVTRDERAFTVLVRGALFQLLRSLSRKDYAAAALAVAAPEAGKEGAHDVDGDVGGPWDAERFARALAPFYEEHASIRVDPQARAPAHTRIDKPGRGVWEVQQVISDDADDNDWWFRCFVDLERSAREGKPVVVMRELSR
jgi:hypothetical protein